MTAVRSYAYAAVALGWTIIVAILYLPLLAMPRRIHWMAVRVWAHGLLAMLGFFCNLRHRVVGRENLPDGPVLIAAKHQSAWETLALVVLLERPVFILKEELLRVPLTGWHFRKAGNIGIDRRLGSRALRAMVPAAEAAVAAGHQVVVFPEGTRVAVGERGLYQPGIAALYGRLTVPCIPVAVNSGQYWARRSGIKYPGLITLAFLPAMPAGLDRRTFMGELETRIEEASAELLEGTPDITGSIRDRPRRIRS